MPVISVVIPAYNASSYIAQALDSLLVQTFTDWECVVVNDGSTDDTLAIVESYAARDTRIRYTTIKNSGAAKLPRDTAVSLARGEWIVALDADDYLDSSSLENLLTRAQQTHADMVLSQMLLFDNISGEIILRIPAQDFDTQQVLSGTEGFALTIGHWDIGLNGALILRALWQSKQSYLSPENHMNIDEYDSREMLLKAHYVAIAGNSVYHYRHHTSSITRKPSYKLFEPLITDRMVLSLLTTYLPNGSGPEIYRTEERKYLQRLLKSVSTLTRDRYTFSKTDRDKAKAIVHNELNILTHKQIWGSPISLRRKVLLSLPASLLFGLYRLIAVLR